MSKIVFFQNHVVINTPGYAINLLSVLTRKGHEVIILTNSNYQNPNHDLISKSFDVLYSDYEVVRIQTLEGFHSFMVKFSPDLFLTDLTMPRSDKLSRQIHKVAKKYAKVLEMDNRSTEILAYCRKNWYYNAQFSPYKHQRLIGFTKAHILSLINNLTFGHYGSNTRKLSHVLHSDILTLKGKWWLNQLVPYFSKEYVDRIRITGSLRYDYIKSQASSSIDYRNYGLDPNKSTIMICPTKENNEFGNNYYNSKLFNLVDKIRDNFDLNIVVKLHPGDIKNNRTDKFNYINENNFHICSPDDFYSFLSKSKFVLSQFSSIGIESSIFNVPKLFFDSFTHSARLDNIYMQKGMTIGCGINGSNIIEIVNSIINKEINFNFSEYNRNVLNGVDGKSHLNISNEIENLLTT